MKTKKKLFIGVIVIAALALGYVAIFYYNNLRGIWAPLLAPTADVSTVIQQNNGAFKLPPGFGLSIFAKNLPGSRVLAFDADGNLWVSQTSSGDISKLTVANGQLISQKTMFTGLKKPHGLAFDPENKNILYIAEELKISRVDLSSSSLTLEKIADLPKGGNHSTRTLGFGPDGKLYVSIGSTCNVCNESDARYAAIYSLNKDGSNIKQVAKGLRNSVFFTWNNVDGKMWATEMGRDLLGDDVPPDEINVIDTTAADVLNFGWPICYGKNIHDSEFDKNTYIRNPCTEPFETPSRIDLQAHSAPLGISFVPANTNWPADYHGNLIVAFHGSWNRSVPTGYKVVRLILDPNGNLTKQEDFITGWLTQNGVIGRPVAIVFDKTGNMYISDDNSGSVYKLEYKGK